MAPLAEAPPQNAVFPWLKGLVLLVGLAGAGLALRLLGADALHGSRPTPAGAASFVVVGALLAAGGAPRLAIAFAGGYAFGAWRGGGLAMLAQLLGCAADFWWARWVAPGWARRRLGGRIDRLLQAKPFTATLTLRLLPVGNNLLLNLLAGVSGVPARQFFAATLLGYLPQTAIFSLAGSGIQVGGGARLAIGVALFTASGLLGWVLLRTAAQES